MALSAANAHDHVNDICKSCKPNNNGKGGGGAGRRGGEGGPGKGGEKGVGEEERGHLEEKRKGKVPPVAVLRRRQMKGIESCAHESAHNFFCGWGENVFASRFCFCKGFQNLFCLQSVANKKSPKKDFKSQFLFSSKFSNLI